MTTALASKGILQLLDREPPGDYFRECTQRVAAGLVCDQGATHSIIAFRLEMEWLGLPTGIFREVVDDYKLHTIPHRNPMVAGIVSVRGELLLCASLAKILGLDEDGASIGRRRLLIAQRGSDQIAFPVDEVYGVVGYHPRELIPPPATLAQAAATYTIGLLPWKERTVGRLDEELLFYTLSKSFA